MSGNRRLNPKRDGNEPDIVRALQAAGAVVVRINGKDICDLLCHYNMDTYLIEVKMPKGVISEGQAAFIYEWNKAGGHAGVVRTVDEALAFIGTTS